MRVVFSVPRCQSRSKSRAGGGAIGCGGKGGREGGKSCGRVAQLQPRAVAAADVPKIIGVLNVSRRHRRRAATRF